MIEKIRNLGREGLERPFFVHAAGETWQVGCDGALAVALSGASGEAADTEAARKIAKMIEEDLASTVVRDRFASSSLREQVGPPEWDRACWCCESGPCACGQKCGECIAGRIEGRSPAQEDRHPVEVAGVVVDVRLVAAALACLPTGLLEAWATSSGAALTLVASGAWARVMGLRMKPIKKIAP